LPDGAGKALRLTVHPVREHIPIYLAAVGPKNLELTGEIADGWLAIFFSPEHAALSLDAVRAGREKADRGTEDDRLAGFDVVPTVPVVIADDIETAAEPLRNNAALYVGGMGSRKQNFYNALAVRMGYEQEAAEVQDLFLDRRYRDAAAAVPLSFIDQTSLIGPRERVRDGLAHYAEAGVTTLTVATFDTDLERRLQTVRTMAELLDESGLGESA
jgi:alkanesulfonate monooxygenase SsuD/methylene tetrahydromethanopterin reductase-like flavin-dependent oxidoreductase (luciferase family)